MLFTTANKNKKCNKFAPPENQVHRTKIEYKYLSIGLNIISSCRLRTVRAAQSFRDDVEPLRVFVLNKKLWYRRSPRLCADFLPRLDDGSPPVDSAPATEAFASIDNCDADANDEEAVNALTDLAKSIVVRLPEPVVVTPSSPLVVANRL